MPNTLHPTLDPPIPCFQIGDLVEVRDTTWFMYTETYYTVGVVVEIRESDIAKGGFLISVWWLNTDEESRLFDHELLKIGEV
tara:strand:- start:521 stop:766 length:246 start_codon:yes stop_codon:yes gene_type:complete